MCPCRPAFLTDSCKELAVLLPQLDHSAGSSPAKLLPSSLSSARLRDWPQVLGKVPEKALYETLSTLKLRRAFCGRDPDRRLWDRSSNERLAGRFDGCKLPLKLLLAKYSSCKLAGQLADEKPLSLLEEKFRTSALPDSSGTEPESSLSAKDA